MAYKGKTAWGNLAPSLQEKLEAMGSKTNTIPYTLETTEVAQKSWVLPQDSYDANKDSMIVFHNTVFLNPVSWNLTGDAGSGYTLNIPENPHEVIEDNNVVAVIFKGMPTNVGESISGTLLTPSSISLDKLGQDVQDKINASNVEIVNDLTTGGVDKVASAETVKTLKTSQDAIKTTADKSWQKDTYNNTNISNLGMFTASRTVYFYDWDTDNSKLDAMFINIPAINYSGIIKLTITSSYSVGNAMGGAEVIYHIGKVGATSYMNQKEIITIPSTSFGTRFFIGNANYQPERLFIPITKAPNSKNALSIKIDLIATDNGNMFDLINNITLGKDALIAQPHPWIPQTSSYVSKTDRMIRVGDWGAISDNASGKFYVASNAYLSGNDLKYSNTHASFGARGLIFDWGASSLNTLKFFDTGSKSTVQNENFSTAEYIVWHEGNAPFKVGSGNPEGIVTAKMGTIYLNQNGGTGTTLYVKQSGTGNTGWVAK